MKYIMQASEVGSTLTHEKGFKGKAVFKTIDRGQYAIKAKNIIMENAKTGEKIELGGCTPVSAKELFAANMVLPRTRLQETFPGVVDEFFAGRGTWSDKDEWIVNYAGAK
jgi:hypothetical protein